MVTTRLPSPFARLPVQEGGLGCAESHIAVWRQAAQTPGWTIVFEDDTTLRPNFDAQLARILTRLPPDASMLYFGNIIGSAIAKSLTEYDDTLWLMDGNHWGTYAYAVSQAAAQTLLSHVYPLDKQIDSVIMRIAKEQKLKVFMSQQQMVAVDNSAQRVSNVQRYKVEEFAIPLTFHFMWLGKVPPPEAYIGNMEKWRAMYPEATITLWTDDNMPQLQNQALFDAATSVRQKSYLARYEIVLQHGTCRHDAHLGTARERRVACTCCCTDHGRRCCRGPSCRWHLPGPGV